jgi:alanine racemase
MTTHVQVRLGAIRHNVAQVLAHLAPSSQLLAVVKANAYGHGLAEVARTCVDAGACWLGVSTVAEGVALREAGLEAPILVFLPPLPDETEALVRHGLTATIIALPQVRQLADTAQALGRTTSAHIYIDTGLGRIGSDDSLPDLLEAAGAFPQLEMTGVYSHFGPPGSGQMLEDLENISAGASVRGFAGLARDAVGQVLGRKVLLHAAASSLFLSDRAWHLDMVRIGNLLYGQYPDHITQRPLDLREDTFELHSRIIALQTLPRGSRVGYAGEFICARETKVATVPVGVAQGLGAAPQSTLGRPRGLVKAWLVGREGRRGQTTHAPVARLGTYAVPLIGRISMDQCSLDVTDVPETSLGDGVVLPVRRLLVDSSIPRVYCED